MQAEGLGRLYVRLLTANFEEAVAARAQKRPVTFTDDREREESTAGADEKNDTRSTA